MAIEEETPVTTFEYDLNESGCSNCEKEYAFKSELITLWRYFTMPPKNIRLTLSLLLSNYYARISIVHCTSHLF